MPAPLSGAIRFEFDNDFMLFDVNGDGRYSPMVDVGGVPWLVLLSKNVIFIANNYLTIEGGKRAHK